MLKDVSLAIAQRFLGVIEGGPDASVIADLFVVDLSFEIQGDEGALPWIGCGVGRKAVVDFLHDLRALTSPVRFDVDEILTSTSRAAIVGALETRLNSNGAIIKTQFVIVLTIGDGQITRFQMLEDSFGVSRAARGR